MIFIKYVICKNKQEQYKNCYNEIRVMSENYLCGECWMNSGNWECSDIDHRDIKPQNLKLVEESLKPKKTRRKKDRRKLKGYKEIQLLLPL